MATPMTIEIQNQVLNALVMLTRLLQQEEPDFYLRKHDNRALAAIEAALQRPLVNRTIANTIITEDEIHEDKRPKEALPEAAQTRLSTAEKTLRIIARETSEHWHPDYREEYVRQLLQIADFLKSITWIEQED